jgi:hypothetical protein
MDGHKRFGIVLIDPDISVFVFMLLHILWQLQILKNRKLKDPWDDLVQMSRDTFPDSLLDLLTRLISYP